MTYRHFLRAADAAEYLGLSRQTMARWRCEGGKIPFSRIGSAVVYDVADLDAYVAAHRHRSTSDPGTGTSESPMRPRPAYASAAKLSELEGLIAGLSGRLVAVEEFLRRLRFPVAR